MILVLHPWPLLRAGVAQVMGEFELLEPGDLARALDWTAKYKPKLALLEPLAYPTGVRTLAGVLPVIALTTSTDPGLMQQVLLDGASGYVIASESLGALRTAIESVLGGTPRLGLRHVRELTQRLAQAQQWALGARSELTGRELQVLVLIAQGATNREIAKTLSLAESTVANTCNRLYESLGVRNRVEAALRALSTGLVNIHTQGDQIVHQGNQHSQDRQPTRGQAPADGYQPG